MFNAVPDESVAVCANAFQMLRIPWEPLEIVDPNTHVLRNLQHMQML